MQFLLFSPRMHCAAESDRDAYYSLPMIKTGSALSIGGDVLPMLEQLSILYEFVVIDKPLTTALLFRESEEIELDLLVPPIFSR